MASFNFSPFRQSPGQPVDLDLLVKWLNSRFKDAADAVRNLASSLTITETNLSLADVTTDDVSITKHGFAPKAPNDATQFLNGVGAYSKPAAGAQTVFLTADVSNSNSAVNQATGLKANVVAGSTYTFRWHLWYNSNANTGGVVSTITHPAYTAAITHHRGNTTAVGTLTDTVSTLTTSPLNITTYVSYSGFGVVIVEHTVTPSANGTVEMTIHPASTGQNYTLKAGSFLEVFGPT